MGAIVLAQKQVHIDYEACVECGVCRRFGICKEDAIRQVDEIPYPRVVRAAFSDPLEAHANTGVGGRGTEEMKTNDVTDMFQAGQIGFSIEIGRPGLGAYLSDMDKVVRKVTSLGGVFAPDNPVYPLISDRSSGALKPEVLREKVMSAIAEFLIPEEKAMGVVKELAAFLNAELDSVASMSVICRADERGDCRFLKQVKQAGFAPYPNGKVNIGMARI